MTKQILFVFGSNQTPAEQDLLEIYANERERERERAKKGYLFITINLYVYALQMFNANKMKYQMLNFKQILHV